MYETDDLQKAMKEAFAKAMSKIDIQRSLDGIFEDIFMAGVDFGQKSIGQNPENECGENNEGAI